MNTLLVSVYIRFLRALRADLNTYVQDLVVLKVSTYVTVSLKTMIDFPFLPIFYIVF